MKGSQILCTFTFLSMGWESQTAVLEHFEVQATLVISTPDNSILPLISKCHESPNFFLYIVIAFRLWISQSMDNWKLWISHSGFSVPNCKLYMFILLLISKCKLSVTQNVMWQFEDYLFVKYTVGKIQN